MGRRAEDSPLLSSYSEPDFQSRQCFQADFHGGVVIDMEVGLKKMWCFRQASPCHFPLISNRFCWVALDVQASATLFSQITSGLYPSEFLRLVQKYPSSKPPRGITQYDQFLALCFGQLTYRESLRAIVACLNSKPRLLYHLGFRGNITRTNLAYANKHRDWRLFQGTAQLLMRRAANLYRDDSAGVNVSGLVFALDSSMISLALNLFPWAYYARSTQAAVKLHLMLSLKGNLPAWAVITGNKIGDMRMLEEIPLHPGAHYVFTGCTKPEDCLSFAVKNR
jgi:Domain of unknown function (DUF4372)